MRILPLDELSKQLAMEITTHDKKIINDFKRAVGEFQDECLGLAAPQFGIPYQIMYCNLSSGARIMINPDIQIDSDKRFEHKEGCLSIEGKMFKVNRPTAIRVIYQSSDLKFKELRLSAHPSIPFSYNDIAVICHEYDHLMGDTIASVGKEIV